MITFDDVMDAIMEIPMKPDAMMICGNSELDVRDCSCPQCTAIKNWNKAK